MKRILKKKSEIFREVLESGQHLRIYVSDCDPHIIVFGNVIQVYVPYWLSPEAQAGLVIFELYAFKSDWSHVSHIKAAYELSAREEKKLIRKGLEEFFGKRLRFRDDWKYYCRFW